MEKSITSIEQCFSVYTLLATLSLQFTYCGLDLSQDGHFRDPKEYNRAL